MVRVDVPKVRGKMAEKGYTISSMAKLLDVNRNTLAAYLENPEKMPYCIVSGMADILCDTLSEAAAIFFSPSLSFNVSDAPSNHG